MATGVVDIFLVYQFLKRLATPFEKWDAFKEGIIDKEGNVIMSKKERKTPAQKKAFQIFDLMILKLKNCPSQIFFILLAICGIQNLKNLPLNLP